MANKKKNTEILGKAKVFKAPFTITRDKVKLTFPRTILEYIHASNGSVFWSPVNGVVQVSGLQPHMVIPMLSLDEDNFVLQDSGTAPVVAAE
jgi:hypothetical protein